MTMKQSSPPSLKLLSLSLTLLLAGIGCSHASEGEAAKAKGQAAKPATSAPAAPPAATAPADQTKATVVFSPAQVQTPVGGTVSVNFMVSNAADLFSMPLTFTFDPHVVRLSDVTQGPVLASDGVRAAFSKNIQNDSGTASISISRMFGRPGVSGNGVLLTLVFQGVAAGQSQVTLPQVGLRDSKGNLVPLTSAQPPQAVITVK